MRAASRLEVWPLLFLATAAGALLLAWLIHWRKRRPRKSVTVGFARLQDELARAAETGGGSVHIALGGGGLAGDRAMASVSGLAIAASAADQALSYGLMPTVFVGDATLMAAAQDMLYDVFDRHGLADQYDPVQVRFIAPAGVPFSAGAGDVVEVEGVRVFVVVGAHDADVSLTLDPGVRQGLVQYAAIDTGAGSAVSFSATDWLAPGEGLFAAAAQEAGCRDDRAALLAQDVLRWVVVAAVIGAALWVLAGG